MLLLIACGTEVSMAAANKHEYNKRRHATFDDRMISHQRTLGGFDPSLVMLHVWFSKHVTCPCRHPLPRLKCFRRRPGTEVWYIASGEHMNDDQGTRHMIHVPKRENEAQTKAIRRVLAVKCLAVDAGVVGSVGQGA